MRKILSVAPAVLLLAVSVRSLAHEGHHHPEGQPETAARAKPTPSLDRINQAYLAKVKPILQQKCFDCHTDQTKYPWYHSIPGVGWYIDRDIRQARKHLDFTQDFPFKSHATPDEDLKAIGEELEEGDMPPLLYKLAHGAGLTDAERDTVLSWAREGRELLKADAEAPH